MKYSFALVLFLICATADCQTKTSAYVFMLGKDTVGYEQYSRSPDKIEGDILTLPPKATIAHFKILLNNGSVSQFEYYSADPLSMKKTLEREITVENDTTIRQKMSRNGKVDSFFTRSFSARPGSVPYFDSDISMYEQMILQGLRSGKDSIPVDRLSNVPMRSYIKRTDNNEYEARFFSFPVLLKTDAGKNVTSFDATASTLKVIAHTIPNFDFQSLTARYVRLEATKGTMGNLSSTDTSKTSFKGVDFEIQYGRPLRRGRLIFGDIVPWNKVWRTGANYATHFTTSKDLVFGSFTVPAGRYTLWTLPESGGAKLIINKVVNIFGTQYNPRGDLVRLDMVKTENPTMVEQLTIKILETEDGGKLVIKWEQTVYTSDFKIIN